MSEKPKSLKVRLKEAETNAEMSWDCLMMIRDDLVALGIKMDSCPPMFYNDAIRSAIVEARLQVQEAAATICDDAVKAYEAKRSGSKRMAAVLLAAEIRDKNKLVARLRDLAPVQIEGENGRPNQRD